MYANGYQGDQQQLSYVAATLEEKLYAIPGVTCDDALSVNMDGEAFNYYVRSITNTETGRPGKHVDFESTGVRRVNCEFKKAQYLKDVIPYVNYATASADVVGDKVVQDSITIANKLNEEFVGVACNYSTTATTTWDGSADGYNTLLRLRAEFKKANQEHNVDPTACFVSSALYSKLLAQNVLIFKDGKKFGELLGFSVIEVPSLDVSGKTYIEDTSLTATGVVPCHAVMMNAKGMISAENLRSLMVTDGTAAGWPNSTLISGELSTYIAPSKLVTDGEGCPESVNASGFTNPEPLIFGIRA